jgi:pimeloyl-ACP methyl ester carboxylesterase
MLARLSNRRDIVLIDQRGTGRSAPLHCAEMPPTQPLGLASDPEWQLARLRDCRKQLQSLPHGDLRHYSTWVAVQDVDAVRSALGAAQINLIGASYGTRAALEYMRQFPQAVRRAVLDGVAPPDMVLPASAAGDNQAAFDAVLAACEADAICSSRFPALRRSWQALLSSLPRQVSVTHPLTGQREIFVANRELVLALLRAPLYSPSLAAAVPHAVSEAAQNRFEALFGLAGALAPGRRGRIAEGMHFSVICSEDLPRLPAANLLPPTPPADFGDSFAVQYTRVCSDWPRAEVPPAFYTLTPARVATLLMSGGADPATPPHHGQRAAAALGAKARHVVVAQAGHGVMALPCMRDVLFRFIDAPDDEAALKVDADCASKLPRAAVFTPPAPASAP